MHTSMITNGPKSNFICENIATKAILFFFGCSEVNSTWLITSELANQRAPKVLFTRVVYANCIYFSNTCRIASTKVIVPGGPNNRYGVGRHWPLTIRETAALWRSFRDVLYKKSSGLYLLEDSALLSIKGVPLKNI